ncbi:hypothetical protein GJR93_28890 [Aminobacter sp. MDW-2]|jgi:hypothetical protein|nr:hypothetical protein [Aminobacter sp. MDW-2]
MALDKNGCADSYPKTDRGDHDQNWAGSKSFVALAAVSHAIHPSPYISLTHYTGTQEMQMMETAPVKAWAVVDETGKITPPNIHASEIKAAATAKRWGKTYRVIPVFVIPIGDWSGGTDEGTPVQGLPAGETGA